MTEAAVSVIVPVRNGAGTLGDTLAGLAAQKPDRPFEVIVVDDHSTDATADVARAAPLVVTLISPDQAGAAHARNAGVAAASAPVVAFTDADCVPDGDWLAAGLAALEHADFVQGRVVPLRRRRDPFERTLDVPTANGLFESANWFVDRGLYERLGGVEQWIGRRGERPFGEDIWFGWRAIRAGARFAFARDAVVRHAVFPGSWTGLIKERWRLRYFPHVVVRAPELRANLTWRYFLTGRTARFDLALFGLVLMARTRTLAFGVCLLPYTKWSVDRLKTWGRGRLPKMLALHLIADAVGCVALLYGTIRAKRAVL